MPGLERPDALAQPGEQPAAFGQAAEERLPQMYVTLDQAGEHETVGDVEHPCFRVGLEAAGHGRDASVTQQQIGRAHRSLGVQGEERAAA